MKRRQRLKHRRIAGGARGCCSTPKLSEKTEIFRLSEILGCLSEIFITYLYKNAFFIIAKMVLLFFRSTQFSETMLASIGGFSVSTAACINKKAQLSLTNPRDACEKFAWFT